MWKWIKKHSATVFTSIVGVVSSVAEYAPEILTYVVDKVPDYTFIGQFGLPIAAIIRGYQQKKDYNNGQLKPGGLTEKALDKIPDFVTGKKNSKKIRKGK